MKKKGASKFVQIGWLDVLFHPSPRILGWDCQRITRKFKQYINVTNIALFVDLFSFLFSQAHHLPGMVCHKGDQFWPPSEMEVFYFREERPAMASLKWLEYDPLGLALFLHISQNNPINVSFRAKYCQLPLAWILSELVLSGTSKAKNTWECFSRSHALDMACLL